MWSYFRTHAVCVCVFMRWGRGYGITPPAYWLLAAWHWSETGKPANRGRYEYAKAWLLFMIKAYLIWKWEQARWLKEHWVVGQNKKKNKKEGMKKRWGKGTPSSPYKWRGEQTGMSLNVNVGFRFSRPVWVQEGCFILWDIFTSFHPVTTVIHLRWEKKHPALPISWRL